MYFYSGTRIGNTSTDPRLTSLLHTAGAGTHDRLETEAPCHTGSGDRHDAAGNWITDHRLRDRLGHASHGGGMSSSCYKHLIRAQRNNHLPLLNILVSLLAADCV